MSDETILVASENNVCTVTLNRPDAMNSITEGMGRELQKVLKAIACERSIRCLVLTGAGRAFCAGQDLNEATGGKQPLDFAERLRRVYNPVIKQLRSMKAPTVASINGAAAGAGWSLALACDLRIASSKVKFVSAFCSIGLIPDCAMSSTLLRLVGYGKALEIAWFSDPIPAETALQWGLIHRMVEPDALPDVTREWAERLAQRPTKGLVLTRRAFEAGLENDLETQLEYEAVLQGIAGRTKDYAEGVSAFIEKRQPEFTGE